MMGATEAACWSAAHVRLEMLVLTASQLRMPPSFTPRAFAAARAALVRLTDALSLVFCHERHDADRETVSVRHISGDELDAAVLQREKKRSVAGQPVQARDHQLCAGLATAT